MSCHIDFLINMEEIGERREREIRERGGGFVKQPPHSIKPRAMRRLMHHYTSSCCHATHKHSFFLCTNFKTLELL